MFRPSIAGQPHKDATNRFRALFRPEGQRGSSENSPGVVLMRLPCHPSATDFGTPCVGFDDVIEASISAPTNGRIGELGQDAVHLQGGERIGMTR